MEKVTKPNVRDIALGKNLIAKQMQAEAGALLPKHLADVESILFIHEGECNLNMNEEDIVLKKGEGYVIPPNTKHQIKVITDFKGLHFMPAGIKFEFFN
ncbi:MAG: cupin domain-containing protein [Ginsengibacter sp.]